ncbi:MAG TPA: hypothetical protein VMA31_15410 [Bryobacteraceae bacterium]|nr:hypothetical protein [Bryobacteraceae bacterium]
MSRLHKWCGLAMVALPLVSVAQTPDLQAILNRLDRLERENQELKKEVTDLKARLDGKGPASASNGETEKGETTAAVPLEQQVAVAQSRIDEMAQTKVESSQKLPIRLAGMALFNTFLDSHQSGGVDYPVVAAAPGTGHGGATLRQTILGLEFRDPTAVWGGSVHGNVYMDFFASSGTAARLRTGEIEIDWKTRSLMAGLEKPIFNPREPSSLAQVGVSPLTGAGNLWLWVPQVRFEQDFSFAEMSGLRAQVGVIQTREVLPYAGSPFTGPLEPARPGLEGRFEFYYKLDDDRRIEIAPGFHLSETHAGGVSIPSQLVSVDWFVNPWKPVEFSGAFYNGQNVAPLGNGFAEGFYGYGRNLEAVPSIGGWGQITIHTLPRLDFHFFAGQQQNRAADLAAGLITHNLMYGGNFFYRIAPNVLVGIETTQLRTLYISQGVRINNHYDLALAYLF